MFYWFFYFFSEPAQNSAYFFNERGRDAFVRHEIGEGRSHGERVVAKDGHWSLASAAGGREGGRVAEERVPRHIRQRRHSHLLPFDVGPLGPEHCWTVFLCSIYAIYSIFIHFLYLDLCNTLTIFAEGGIAVQIKSIGEISLEGWVELASFARRPKSSITRKYYLTFEIGSALILGNWVDGFGRRTSEWRHFPSLFAVKIKFLTKMTIDS